VGAGFAWTAERIAEKSLDEVKNLRENAERLGQADIVALCDADLARRKPTKPPKPSKRQPNDRVVHGFHFVCPDETGVVLNVDGTRWSGTWVVDQRRVEQAVKIGAYVALHRDKSQPSYLQGVVRGWRVSERELSYAKGAKAKTPRGIDFLIEPTDRPLPWCGDGTGEKGYYYGENQPSQSDSCRTV
jgi:hypothetical protein